VLPQTPVQKAGATEASPAVSPPLKIMQRAGHADFDTTLIYLREAEEPRRRIRGCLSSDPGRCSARVEFRIGFGFCH
jgi:hypothetical protein